MIARVQQSVGRIRRASTQLMRSTLRRLASSLDIDVVARNTYSPIPRVPPASSGIWERRNAMRGIDFDPIAHVRYLESELAPFLAEFRPPLDRSGAGGSFYLRNGYYGPLDAHVLYAMIRRHRPRRVLELGAGYSTLVSACACAVNALSGPIEFVTVDPEPRLPVERALHGNGRIERRSCAELPLERFLELESNDILFVDTSHTVKLGSEVNFLVLEVLPQLRPGVLVHFHDIYLPYEYPRAWFARGTFCTEQYLVQAFLGENPRWQILFAAHAVAREQRDRIEHLVPSLRQIDHAPSAFWLRRMPPPSD